MRKIVFSILLLVSTQIMANLPEGFVYVRDIDPTIKESIRYTTEENFVGAPIKGYVQPKAILTKEAAIALSKVQQELLREGYSLVIYDAYRPQQAVDHFVVWGADVKDDKTKEVYYPRISKKDVFEQHYVAPKSTHTRGSTMDVTIISTNASLKSMDEMVVEKRTLKDGLNVLYLNDGTVDMGTSFDLFDQASHPNSVIVEQKYLDNRNYLQVKMEEQGFEVHHSEWWHFTLKNEPFPDTYFNFVVE
jgi:D-alanyl-D-alanine dipeptidase